MEQLLRRELFKYGFLPLLIYMERVSEDGNYELCNTILKVIKSHNTEFGFDFPTKLNGEAVAQMKIDFMVYFGLSGDIAHKNSEHYADLIGSEVLSFMINKGQNGK